MKKVIPFTIHKITYRPDDIIKVLNKAINDNMLIGNNKGIYTYNVSCAFDIETSSFYIDKMSNTYTYSQLDALDSETKKHTYKSACMYVWQLGINGYTIIGRTWDEFLTVCDKISKHLHLSDKKKLIIYVHNLSYEYGFISHLFKWEKVFSIETRKPIYAITSKFIEFRCSYLLSGYSLKNLAKQCIKYPCEKKVGDLDYSLVRHTKTQLTDLELGYCKSDVDVVMSYIQEKIENDGNITKIPLTKTGYVRKYCRKRCLYYNGTNKRDFKYKQLMSKLQMTLEEYQTMKRAFSGGFTHANALEVGETHNNISSYDFTSSYPYVMISEKFPMSKGVKIDIKNINQFETILNDYLAVFDIRFHDLMQRYDVVENPLSVSKCWSKKDVTENNGRVVCAEMVTTTITSIDYNVFKQFYTWSSCEVKNCYTYHKDYLPTSLVNCVLDLYEQKTTLKGVKDKLTEYQASKEMINACYGMCVTDPLRDLITFDGIEWGKEEQDPVKMLEEHNNSMNRFLFYPWGVFVTAYARRNLFTAIKTIGVDYIYADTDSVKIKNKGRYENYFDKYNKMVYDKLKKACNYHNIDFNKVQPKTIKGITKTLGVWDYEGTYSHFKTLGAKRYMTCEDGELSLTVSGVNKYIAIPYLLKKYDNNIDKIFNIFDNKLKIPPNESGKNIHTYLDHFQEGIVTDYLGNKEYYRELSSVHLEPTGYNLSLADLFIKYLKNIKTEVI